MTLRAADDHSSVPAGTLVQTPERLLQAAPHHRIFEALGAHLREEGGTAGVAFCVWAPNAREVSVIGDFNGWQPHPMQSSHDGNGRWSVFIPGAGEGDCYKYRVQPQYGEAMKKADPMAFGAEAPPSTASKVTSLAYSWNDGDWMEARARKQAMDQPMSVYEVHLGSWQRAEDGTYLNYREIGHRLAAHCDAMGFTHVELMPIAEHPFYGSWGYQVSGYYAATARYGSPQDLMALVDTLHQRGFGVLLDWVPSHFPADAHSLATFDGTHLYEHQDPRLGFHPQWNSLIFNYGRYEVRDFLIANAIFWLQYYHFDGLRVDAVASMLYLDFAREDGNWLPNEHGGNENLPAVKFLRELNTAVYHAFPDVHMIAEESSSWPGVSRPVDMGGLGFGMKWNMGWMNDTLRYVERPHFYREYHQDELKFTFWYAFNENFVLPLSHDEVVYGKGSLYEKQPGDEWQKAAGLRGMFGFMWGHPGKKMLFMGGEFGQEQEWHHERTLDWHLWEQDRHAGIARWVADLNRAYRALPALHRHDFDKRGFSWAHMGWDSRTVLAFWRHAGDGDGNVLVLCNQTPQPLHNLQIGVAGEGFWHELLNSDASEYGGSGMGNLGGVHAVEQACGEFSHSLRVTLPPLGVVYLSDRPLSQAAELPEAATVAPAPAVPAILKLPQTPPVQ